MGDQWVDIPFPLDNAQGVTGYAGGAGLSNLMARKNHPTNPHPVSIVSTPGLLSATTSGTGDIRGMLAHGSYLWFVRGTELYRSSGGAGTLVGTVAGTAPVQMVGAGVNQIAIVDGAGNEYSATSGAVSAIAPPAGNFSDVTFMDGYIIAIRDGTDEFYISALDGTTFGALDFSTADAVSDVLIGCYVHNRELYLFGKKHTEVWVNTGASPFPFQRATPGVIDVGLYAPGSIAHHQARMFFVGSDMCVYTMNGYTPIRASNTDVESIIRSTTDPTLMRASTYSDTGQVFYTLTPSLSSSVSYVYDIENNWWHQRSHGASGNGGKYVDVANYTGGSGYLVYAAIRPVAGFTQGVYILTLDQALDSGSTPPRILIAPIVNAKGRRVFSAETEITMRPATGSVVMDTLDELATSTTFASVVTTNGLVRIIRCGSFKNRRHTFTFTCTTNISIDSVRARVEVGL